MGATTRQTPGRTRVGAVGQEVEHVDDPATDNAEPWGVRLRHWRDEVQCWSQQELVDRIVQLAYQSKEDRGTRLEARREGTTVGRLRSRFPVGLPT